MVQGLHFLRLLPQASHIGSLARGLGATDQSTADPVGFRVEGLGATGQSTADPVGQYNIDHHCTDQ
jgi:hypothetical protein